MRASSNSIQHKIIFVIGPDLDTQTMNDDDDEIGVTNDKTCLTTKLDEKWWHITIQVAIPFFIAGFGTIGAGIILGHVEVSCSINVVTKPDRL